MSNTEGFKEWWKEAKKLYDGDSQLCALRAWQYQHEHAQVKLDVALAKQRMACGYKIMELPVSSKWEFKFRELAAYSCNDAKVKEKSDERN